MSLFQKIRKSTHYSMHPDCIAIDDDGNPAIPLRHTSHYPAHESEQHIHPSIIRKTKCFDFWERNVLFPKTKRSFFRTPTLPFSA